MPSTSILAALTAGTAGALFVGYCIYYDRKRRADPEYKRKVRERRQREEEYSKLLLMSVDADGDASSLSGGGGMQQLLENDPYMELCFLNEIKLGEQLVSQGQVSEGLSHLSKAIMMCAQPTMVLETLQESLPERVFMPLITQLQEMQSRTTTTTSSSSSSSSNKDVSMTSSSQDVA